VLTIWMLPSMEALRYICRTARENPTSIACAVHVANHKEWCDIYVVKPEGRRPQDMSRSDMV
jgi:hypothetical protein